jgi:hypothetical protein
MSDTTLLGWLGRTAPPKKQPVAINPRSLSPLNCSATGGGGRPQKRKPIAEPTLYVLGFMGIRNGVSYEEMQTNILAPVVEAWGIPDEVVTPAEGDATQAIITWCHNHNVPLRLVSCDWAKQGKRAGMMRDARLQKEATHLVLLQGPRSNKLAELAVKLERKHYPVVISPRPGMAVIAPADLDKSLSLAENG